MSIYHQDESVTVHHGDCLDVLKTLADNSIDAVCTDPPYRIAFMGARWDTFDTRQFQQWCQLWATECLRVLKPGGHMAAFGGTRTWHRLACAVEDAGFEIRDNLAWLYGSGFPKSLDISKAIDRRGGNEGLTAEVGRALIAARESRGISKGQADQMFCRGSTNYSWYEGRTAGQRMPTDEDFAKIAATWPELQPYAERVAQANRETVDNGTSGKTYGMGGLRGIETSTGEYAITAPATDAAKQWQGWGTALKPSWESIVLARKPYGISDILDSIGSQLDRLESECKPPANDAGKSSARTQADSHAATTDSAPVNAATPRGAASAKATPTGAVADSSGQTDTPVYGSTANTFSNTVTSWRNCWAEICSALSTSTTETNASLTTDLRTLNSCLAQITHENTTGAVSNPRGLSSIVSAVDNLFASVVCALRATLALSAIENATSGTPTRHQAEAGSQFEPIVLARKPIRGTVAANVLTHGTGGLNIDACRVEYQDDAPTQAEWNAKGSTGSAGANGFAGQFSQGLKDAYADGKIPVPAGRFPPNVLLDPTTAHELDKQSGTLKAGGAIAPGSKGAGPRNNVVYGNDDADRGDWSPYGDSGGASRFFPIFRYTAKAPGTERPSADGITHPTVKPLSLMRWLVKLITPPGGVVLDPFAGTGTTAEAAIHEHKHCIAIEREHTYLPLIVARLCKPMELGFDFDGLGT